MVIPGSYVTAATATRDVQQWVGRWESLSGGVDASAEGRCRRTPRKDGSQNSIPWCIGPPSVVTRGDQKLSWEGASQELCSVPWTVDSVRDILKLPPTEHSKLSLKKRSKNRLIEIKRSFIALRTKTRGKEGIYGDLSKTALPGSWHSKGFHQVRKGTCQLSLLGLFLSFMAVNIASYHFCHSVMAVDTVNTLAGPLVFGFWATGLRLV